MNWINGRPEDWDIEKIARDAGYGSEEAAKNHGYSCAEEAICDIVFHYGAFAERAADAILKARKPIEEEIFQALQGMVCQHCFDWRTGKYKDKGLSVNTIAIRIYRKYKVELGLDD